MIPVRYSECEEQLLSLSDQHYPEAHTSLTLSCFLTANRGGRLQNLQAMFTTNLQVKFNPLRTGRTFYN